jgi:phosphonate transport system permease protein
MTNVPPRTDFQKYHIKSIIWILLIIAALIVSAVLTEASATDLVSGMGQFFNILVKMSHPDWAYFPTIIQPLLETIRMALVGTLIGTVLAVPFAILSSRNIIKNSFVRGLVRLISNLIRTLPDLLLASLFAAIVGFGPIAGVLTLVVFSFGQMAKLLYESIETIDQGPIEAMTSVGANRIQIIVFAVLPQVVNSFLSNYLYTFEVNIRSSTVLGYVGAGGVGQLLNTTMSMFRYDRSAVIILGILVVVALIEFLSNYLRGKLS